MGGILEQIQAQLNRIEARLAKCTEAPVGDMVDQRRSPLGPRKHCAAVRRMAAEGDTRAYKRGKLYMMSREALLEEMARESIPANAVPESVEDDAFYQQTLAEVGKS